MLFTNRALLSKVAFVLLALKVRELSDIHRATTEMASLIKARATSSRSKMQINLQVIGIEDMVTERASEIV